MAGQLSASANRSRARFEISRRGSRGGTRGGGERVERAERVENPPLIGEDGGVVAVVCNRAQLELRSSYSKLKFDVVINTKTSDLRYVLRVCINY